MTTTVYDGLSSMGSTRMQYSQREDGQWFERVLGHNFRGYAWTRWRAVSYAPDMSRFRAGATRARLPKGAVCHAVP